MIHYRTRSSAIAIAQRFHNFASLSRNVQDQIINHYVRYHDIYCGQCGNTGANLIVRGEEVITDQCICFIGEKQKAKIDKSLLTIPKRYSNCELDNLPKLSLDNSHALTVLNQYIGSLQAAFDNGMNLLITCDNSSVKTHATCAVLKEAIRSGFNCYYTTLAEVIVDVSEKSKGNEDSNRRISDLYNCDFLSIDDCGTFFQVHDSVNLAYFSKIFHYRNGKQKPVIAALMANALYDSYNAAIHRALEPQLLSVTIAGQLVDVNPLKHGQ